MMHPFSVDLTLLTWGVIISLIVIILGLVLSFQRQASAHVKDTCFPQPASPQENTESELSLYILFAVEDGAKDTQTQPLFKREAEHMDRLKRIETINRIYETQHHFLMKALEEHQARQQQEQSVNRRRWYSSLPWRLWRRK